MGAYSFKDVGCNIVGPGLILDTAFLSGVAEDGISIEPAEDKNVMTPGADGAVMHSLIAFEGVKVTIRALKTSPINSILMLAYNLQTSSAALHGANVITVRDPFRGDLHTITKCAFAKRPKIDYAKEGGSIEWTLDGVAQATTLGVGTPEL